MKVRPKGNESIYKAFLAVAEQIAKKKVAA